MRGIECQLCAVVFCIQERSEGGLWQHGASFFLKTARCSFCSFHDGYNVYRTESAGHFHLCKQEAEGYSDDEGILEKREELAGYY